MPVADTLRFPKLCRHKSSNRAYVVVRLANGEREYRYLGRWGSDEAKREYKRVIEQLSTGNGRMPPTGQNYDDLTLNELMVRFLDHAHEHYRRADGTLTSEVEEFRQVFKPLKALYGSTLCRDFGPLALKAVREAMIRADLCRSLVNRRIRRIVHVFRWAVEMQIVNPMVHHALKTVSGLQVNRSKARETEPIQPVPDVVVDETLPIVTRHVAGLLRFQRLTGCRPGEACLLRMCDVDTSGPTWIFRPAHHKLAHRNKRRAIAIGPKAQDLMREFPAESPTDYLFSPRRCQAEIIASRSASRKTPRYPSHMKRNANKRTRKPKRCPGERYTTGSVGQSIRKAIEAENRRRKEKAEREGRDEATVQTLPHWHPNQLRHTFATTTRKAYGLEATQVLLGHSTADVTQVYAERDESLAVRVAQEIG